MQKHTDTTSKFWFGCVLILAFGIFLTFNLYTPLYGDDYLYSFSFSTENPIQSIADIVPSLVAHYNTINGRLVTHFFAQLFLLWGKPIFNIINSMAFIILGIIMYCFSGFSLKKPKAGLLALIYCSLYWLTPGFGQSFLWLDGSSNYLWGVMLLLIFFIPYQRQMSPPRVHKARSFFLSVAYAIVNLLCGIVAGGTNENTSVAIICAIIILIIKRLFLDKEKCPMWMYTGLIGCIFGCAAMLLAPGNSLRAGHFGGFSSLLGILRRALLICFTTLEYMAPIIVAYVALLIIFLHQNSHISKKEKIDTLFPSFLFAFASFISIFAMSAAPQFADRVWSGPLILSVISTGLLFSVTSFTEYAIWKKANKYLLIIILFCTLGSSISTYLSLKNINSFYIVRIETIQQQIENGKSQIVLTPICGDGKYSCYPASGDFSKDTPKVSKFMAKYFGVREIIIE